MQCRSFPAVSQLRPSTPPCLCNTSTSYPALTLSNKAYALPLRHHLTLHKAERLCLRTTPICNASGNKTNSKSGLSSNSKGPSIPNAPDIKDAPPLASVSTPSSTSPTQSLGPKPVMLGGKSTAARTSSDDVQGQQSVSIFRRLVKALSSLPGAISLMAIIAALSGLGTVIPQNKPFEYYVENYPAEGSKVLGFLTYEVIGALQLDHIYTASYFYAALALLGGSLMACTYTRQWPTVKVAQRWRFQTKPISVVKMGDCEVLPDARLQDLGAVLASKGYQVFIQQPSLYAFKGLAGRIGPIGVHLALLLILGGTAYSGSGGFKGTVMCPEGGDFVVGNFLYPASAISRMPAAGETVMHVDKFTIDYRPDGQVAQFYSDLTLRDFEGQELMTKQISVNDPFRYGGVTMYQTDWALASVRMHVLNPEKVQASSLDTNTFSLPLASLEGKPGIAGRLWGTFLPVTPPTEAGTAPKGISLLARDPQSVIFYGSDGKFVGVRRPDSGKVIEVDGVQLVIDGVTGSTGLELKSDPGVPWVYAGFGGLMITTLVSYVSHSQVWALQDGRYVFVAGRSNRAKIGFATEFDEVLESVPELPPPAGQEATKQAPA